jgi:hypothetical protein
MTEEFCFEVRLRIMVHALAQLFRGINIAIGATTLPQDAGYERELKFVLIWLGIMGFFVMWIVVLFYIFAS